MQLKQSSGVASKQPSSTVAAVSVPFARPERKLKAQMSRTHTLSEIILGSVPAAVRWKLDQEIDFEHRDGRGLIIPKHLGRIADVILDWQDVADHLGLSDTDRNDILGRYHHNPKLQRYFLL